MNTDPLAKAIELALRYIDYAPRTKVELDRRLRKAEFEDEIIDSAIAEMERLGFINDEQFSIDWVENRSQSKKLGRTRLGMELRRKGISKELTTEALDSLAPEDELEAAKVASTKWLKSNDIADPAIRNRLSGYLQRRGFNWDIIQQVYSQLLENSI